MMLSPRARTIALAVHIAASVGWLGAAIAYLALDVTTMTTGDATALRSAYHGMDLILRTVIVPLAMGALATGLVMGAGTRWGLLRHWWVLISLILTTVATVVLVIETRTIGAYAAIAADPAASIDQLRALGGTLVHSAGGMLVLLVILVLNVSKPRGLTPYGQRRLAGERTARSTETRRSTPA